ncbi:MAG: crossover junction endodeoxyribonuclease RuvC [Armatimonadetes bacterium]|nr:crossover junction endodeoxyribonuclease RuvC [Armatimonadota bacterium]
MRILGIDPGLAVTGYALVDFLSGATLLLEAGVLRTKESETLSERCAVLFRELGAVLDEFKPNHVCIEELYSHYAHPRTAILMGHARGVICLVAALREIPVTSYPATQIKKSLVGHGRAHKVQMQEAITRQLKLSSRLHPPDVADAMAVALCHLNRARYGRS